MDDVHNDRKGVEEDHSYGGARGSGSPAFRGGIKAERERQSQKKNQVRQDSLR